MKLLIIGVVVNVALCLLWFGWQYLVALGNAFGNRQSPSSVDLSFLMILCVLVTLAVSIGVWFLPVAVARIALALPLLMILGTQLFMWQAERSAAIERRQARLEWAAKEQALLRRARRDFVCIPDELPLGRSDSFLIADVQRGVLARVDVEQSGDYESYAVGTLDGDQIELGNTPAHEAESYYRHFLNASGQSIYDRYEVRYDKDAWYGMYELRDME